MRLFARAIFGLAVAGTVVLGGCSKETSRSSPTAPASVTTLSISGNQSLVAVTQTSQLTATVVLSGGGTQNVTGQASWESSNTAVATVSASGLVTARGFGVTDITAIYQSVKT